MNRPHFPVSGRSGAANMRTSGNPLDSFSRFVSRKEKLSDPAAIEDMRIEMNQDIALTEDRISELRDRVARGDYLTREAAEITASRLFDENFDLS